MGAIESILDVESFEWRSGDVSWGDAAGEQIHKSREVVLNMKQGATLYPR
jgi:hypothetical protein